MGNEMQINETKSTITINDKTLSYNEAVRISNLVNKEERKKDILEYLAYSRSLSEEQATRFMASKLINEIGDAISDNFANNTTDIYNSHVQEAVDNLFNPSQQEFPHL